MVGKIAFLYPGQGSQKVGMGSQLLKVAPALFESYLLRADSATGIPVSRYCLEGPIDLLSDTHIAQPALFAYSLALTDYAHQLGLYPDLVAGHSLGEYTAAVSAGVLSFDDGLHLVCQRGKLMSQIQDERPGAMAAIIGLPAEILHELCESISKNNFVMVASRNMPTQLVVSGVEAGVLELIKAVGSFKSASAFRLKTRGAFHSPLMAPAQSALKEVMKDLTWHDAHVPLVANVSGLSLSSGQEIRQELTEQITSPVQWVACVKTLIEAGCDRFVELGSSQVLTKLVRSIAPESKVFAADTPQKVGTFAETLKDSAYV